MRYQLGIGDQIFAPYIQYDWVETLRQNLSGVSRSCLFVFVECVPLRASVTRGLDLILNTRHVWSNWRPIVYHLDRRHMGPDSTVLLLMLIKCSVFYQLHQQNDVPVHSLYTCILFICRQMYLILGTKTPLVFIPAKNITSVIGCLSAWVLLSFCHGKMIQTGILLKIIEG